MFVLLAQGPHFDNHCTRSTGGNFEPLRDTCQCLETFCRNWWVQQRKKWCMSGVEAKNAVKRPTCTGQTPHQRIRWFQMPTVLRLRNAALDQSPDVLEKNPSKLNAILSAPCSSPVSSLWLLVPVTVYPSMCSLELWVPLRRPAMTCLCLPDNDSPISLSSLRTGQSQHLPHGVVVRIK